MSQSEKTLRMGRVVMQGHVTDFVSLAPLGGRLDTETLLCKPEHRADAFLVVG